MATLKQSGPQATPSAVGRSWRKTLKPGDRVYLGHPGGTPATILEAYSDGSALVEYVDRDGTTLRGRWPAHQLAR